MMKMRTLLIVGLVVFLVSLVLNAPVALLYAKFAPPPGPGMQPSGLAGTLSEGTASSLLLNGQPIVSGLHWRFNPLALLLARASFHVDSTGDLTIDGKAAKLVTGGLNLDNLRATGPLKNLLALSGDLGVPIDGQFGVKLDSARIRGGFVNSVNGELSLNGLRWTLAKDPVLLGDMIAKVTTDDGQITAKIEPVSGPLDVSGEIHLMKDRSYQVDVQVKAKPGSDPLVQNLLHSLGQPDTQGYYHVRSSGTLAGGAAAVPPAAAVPVQQPLPGQPSPGQQ